MTKPLIAALGEILLRLSTPGKKLLRNSEHLDVTAAGAEANVLVGLSSLGHDTRMIGRLPAGELGELARQRVRASGVDCSFLENAPGRMGLYFLTLGAGLRASEIIYDRADSAFALSKAADYDWDTCLRGVTHLHLSGVTPALGPHSAELAIAAASAARARGITLIFDGNYRASLWQTWPSDPRSILTRLVSMADIFFGNHRDISLLLDTHFSGDGPDRRRDAALAAFRAFPNLRFIACTARHVVDAGHNRISARLDLTDTWAQTAEADVTGIVDRIGAGDAFAAGVLHGILQGNTPERIAECGLALTCLKHSVPGDFAQFSAEALTLFNPAALDVRR